MKDEQVFRLLMATNPVPDEDALGSPPALGPSGEEKDTMQTNQRPTTETTRPQPGRRGLLVGAASAVVLIIGLAAWMLVSDGDDAAAPTPTETATAFWEALADGDRQAALDLVDPNPADPSVVVPFGRAGTLAGAFDWYESVGWEWELEGCSEGADGIVECTASARNDWSDAIGVEPISGAFLVRVEETGIIYVTSAGLPSFREQWVPQVFNVFAGWVGRNHPDDANIMWNSSEDVTPEILDLFRVNTDRFVEAQRGG